jgi:hypothetical protein
MKTYTVTNRPQLAGQFAVTRPVSRSKKPGVFSTAFYKSFSDAVEAKGRIGAGWLWGRYLVTHGHLL